MLYDLCCIGPCRIIPTGLGGCPLLGTTPLADPARSTGVLPCGEMPCLLQAAGVGAVARWVYRVCACLGLYDSVWAAMLQGRVKS